MLHTGTASLCEVGVYNAFGGLPTTRIADGGTLAVGSTGTVVTTGAFPTPVELAPQTLYVLAVGCNGTVKLQGAPASSNSGFSTPLVGAPGFAATATQISSTWTFSAGNLPLTFANGGAISTANSDVPNVYAGP